MNESPAAQLARLSHRRFEHLDTTQRAEYFSLIRKGKKREAKQFLELINKRMTQ